MSHALCSDPLARGGPRLYWLTDDGRVMGPGGVVRGSEGARWKGIAAQKDRLLLWDATEIVILDVPTGTVTPTLALDGDVEYAGWVGPSEPDLYELCHHQTTGHPTDRMGYRVRRDARRPDLDGESLGSRQGRGPPWGAKRGYWADQEDQCSQPVGRVLKTFTREGVRLRFAKTGSPGRVMLPEMPSNVVRFFLVTGPRGAVVAGVGDRELWLCAVLPRGTSKRRPFEWKAPDRIRDVVTHEGAIVVLPQKHEPMVVPGAYDALA